MLQNVEVKLIRLKILLQTITITLTFRDICYVQKHSPNKTSGVKRYFLNLGRIIFFKYYRL